MKTVTFHFFIGAKGDSLDWAIDLFSWGKFSHVETELDAPEGKFFSSRPRDGVSFHSDTIPPYKPEDWVRHSIDLSDEQYETMLEFCRKQVGLKYDWISVINFDVPESWTWYDWNNRWFCSEIATAELQEIGMAEALNPTTKVNPSQLEAWMTANIPGIKIQIQNLQEIQ